MRSVFLEHTTGEMSVIDIDGSPESYSEYIKTDWLDFRLYKVEEHVFCFCFDDMGKIKGGLYTTAVSKQTKDNILVGNLVITGYDRKTQDCRDITDEELTILNRNTRLAQFEDGKIHKLLLMNTQ